MPTSLEERNVEYVSPGALTPHPNNPRRHTTLQKSQIKESIDRFGWTVPIIVDEDKTILAGHGRHEVATEQEFESIPIIVISGLSDVDKRAYVLADNRLSENAHWDIPGLLEELEFIGASGLEPELIGFMDDDILGFNSMVDDTDFPTHIPEEPVTKIESNTEPTMLQGDGAPAFSDMKLDEDGDANEEPVEDAFEAAEQQAPPPEGKVFLEVPFMHFQQERIMEVVELAKRVEEVESDTEALFLICELYAEGNEPEEA